MGKRLKVIIVGLPLFSERLATNLSKYDKKNSYIYLNTYYSKWDKIRARFLIPSADLVYSINGSLMTSRVFDLALAKNVPLIMNWVGTDVLKSAEAKRKGIHRQDYIEKAIHYCEVDWIRMELNELGVKAEIVNFAVFDKKFEPRIPQNEFTVLAYIPSERSDFYGLGEFVKMATGHPEIRFLIAGGNESEFGTLPDNVKALGWVKDMDTAFDESHVCVRYPEHDGLSNFILEAMARGKEVLYKYNFEHCWHCPDTATLIKTLGTLKKRFDEGKWEVNQKALKFIEDNFNEEVILGGLVKRFEVIGEGR